MFVLLVLACALVRGEVASASGPHGAAHHAKTHHSANSGSHGLLGVVGKVVKKAGKTVGGVLKNVGAVLDHNPHPQSSTPPPSTRPPTSPPPTSSKPTPPAPHPPAARSTPPTHTSAPAPPPGTSYRPVTQPQPTGNGAQPGATRSASPVATSPSSRTASSASRSTHSVVAFQDTSDIPGLDSTAALTALMVAMMLGVGLIVYRAGHRGARTH